MLPICRKRRCSGEYPRRMRGRLGNTFIVMTPPKPLRFFKDQCIGRTCAPATISPPERRTKYLPLCTASRTSRRPWPAYWPSSKSASWARSASLGRLISRSSLGRIPREEFRLELPDPLISDLLVNPNRCSICRFDEEIDDARFAEQRVAVLARLGSKQRAVARPDHRWIDRDHCDEQSVIRFGAAAHRLSAGHDGADQTVCFFEQEEIWILDTLKNAVDTPDAIRDFARSPLGPAQEICKLGRSYSGRMQGQVLPGIAPDNADHSLSSPGVPVRPSNRARLAPSKKRHSKGFAFAANRHAYVAQHGLDRATPHKPESVRTLRRQGLVEGEQQRLSLHPEILRFQVGFGYCGSIASRVSRTMAATAALRAHL